MLYTGDPRLFVQQIIMRIKMFCFTILMLISPAVRGFCSETHVESCSGRRPETNGSTRTGTRPVNKNLQPETSNLHFVYFKFQVQATRHGILH